MENLCRGQLIIGHVLCESFQTTTNFLFGQCHVRNHSVSDFHEISSNICHHQQTLPSGGSHITILLDFIWVSKGQNVICKIENVIIVIGRQSKK